MPRTLQIAKKATGITKSSATLNRERKLMSQPGYQERLNLVPHQLTPQRVKVILELSTKGNLSWLHEVYDKMDTDHQWGGIVDQILRTLAGSTIKTEQPATSNATDEALAKDYKAFIDLAMGQLKHRDLIKKFGRGVMRGVRAFQMKYEIQTHGTKKLAIPTTIKTIAGQRYLWENELNNDRYGMLKIATSDRSNGVYLDELDRSKVFMIDDGEGHGRWDLLGVYRRAMGIWLLKLYATAWWGDKVEMFGEPFRIAHYGQGTSPAMKDELEMFLQDMGRTAYALIPDGVNLKMVEAPSSANGGISTHGELIRYLDNRLAFTALGQSDTSDRTSHGSRGRTGELMNISWELMEDYGYGIADGYNAMFCSMILANYGEVKKHLVPRANLMVINPSVAKAKLDKFTSMINNGIPVAAETIYEETATNRPSKGDVVFVNKGLERYDEDKSINEREDAKKREVLQQQQGGQSGSGSDNKDNKGTNPSGKVQPKREQRDKGA